MKRVAIIAYEGCWAMTVFSIADFFRIVSLLERHLGLPPHYEVRIVSVDGLAVRAAGGHTLQASGALDGSDPDLIVIPAMEGLRLAGHSELDPRIVAWLSEQQSSRQQILALTTGVSFLAAAGLAKQRLMTTHWAFIGVLTRRYPGCQWVAHRAYLQSEQIWTTGTMEGCFDALLAIVANDRGDHFSQLCASHLLIADPARLNPILPGYRNHGDVVMLKVQDLIETHYADDITVAWMSRQVGVAERTFKRRFQNATTLSPNLYVQKVRIDKAKKLLLATGMSVKAIAYEVGYENVSFFIRLFKQHIGHTPAQWRTLHAQPG